MRKKDALDSLELKTDKSLLTAAEIGILIGLERNTVAKYMKEFQYIPFGKKKKYLITDVAEMIRLRAI